jgi:glycosyltransferase involved in cell wall biosynthesis
MSYTDFSYSATGGISAPTSMDKTHWDIAISCYEPLEMVTGGIGTYTRLLVDILVNDPILQRKNIALFCRKATASLKARSSENFQIFEVPEDSEIYGKPAERLGNEHDWYSWNLSHYLLALTKKGHTFGFFEFSDYAVEGYFSLKMRRAGLLEIGIVGVRLHSPELMLFRDNLLPARAYDPARLTRMSRELFCYQHCDRILYGAPAMLERVAQECQQFGIVINAKAEHIEHPYPVYDTVPDKQMLAKRTSIHLGYIGRLEVRKGILRFLLMIADNELLRRLVTDLDIVFELFGADCPDQNNVSIRSQVLQLQQTAELRGRIIVHGNMPQADLKESIKDLDGFIFPSLFENYPNALLEVLHTDAPILVSEAGGMAYISRGLPGVYSFNYNSDFLKNVESFLCSIRRVPHRKPMYFKMAKEINDSIVTAYGHLAGPESAAPQKLKAGRRGVQQSVDFVIPFYNDAEYVMTSLKSLKNVMTARDSLRVIDDVSRNDQFAALEKAISEIFGADSRVSVHRMPTNSGPSAVRNVGARLGNNSLIQFLDSDDYLNETGFQVTKNYLQNNADVDFAYGIQDNFGDRDHVWIPRDSSVMTCLDENFTHSAVLIRRSVFEDSGGFDDEMRLHFEDWLFNCKLALSGYRGEVVPFVSQHYRVRDGSRTFRNLQREAFSREEVINRSCMKRGPQESMLAGELKELVGKYSSYINGRWHGDRYEVAEEPLITTMSLAELCSLEGEAFVRAAYGVILGRSVDEAGLSFYLTKLDRGVKTRNIVADMVTSSEMRNKRRVLPQEYYRGLRFERMVRHPALKRYLSWKF